MRVKGLRKNRVIELIGLLLIIGIILSGCEGSSKVLNNDIVYKYSGSIGVGDFVDVEINLTDDTYNYTNRITDESGSGRFRTINSSFYEIIDGSLVGNKFTILDDQILLLSVEGEKPGQQLITALKRATGPYGSEIGGTYNVATSLEGWVGTVEISPYNDNPSAGTVQVSLETGQGIETLSGLNYNFDETFNAIKIEEDDDGTPFRHFGIFLNNDVGVFDSYMWDEGEWVGDGMFVLVKQSDSIDLADYAGEYTYIDVDADYGTFELLEDGSVLELLADNEDTGISFSQNDIENGIISFDADLADAGSAQRWNFVFLPGQVIIAASSDDVSFGGDDGGFAIGLKSN